MPRLDKDADVEVKLDSAAAALQGNMTAEQRRGLFEQPDMCVIAIVQLQSKSYTGHAQGEEKSPQVKLRLTLAEVAQDSDQAAQVLEVMRAMMRHRKMNGTLDELGPGSRDVEGAVAEALGSMPTETEFRAHQERQQHQRCGGRVESHG